MIRSISGSNFKKICDECKSSDLFIDKKTGEIICKNCGLVQPINNNTINKTETEYNIDKELGDRTPLNHFFADWGLSTKIDWKNKDHYGNKVPKRTQENLQRLRKWNRRVKINRTKEQNLSKALNFLSTIGSELNLPRNVMNTGSIIYRKALGKNLILGKKIIDIVAASVYIACRQCLVLRTLTEISTASGIPKKTIAKYYRLLKNELDLEIDQYPKNHYINRLTSRLGLLGPIENLSLIISNEAYKNRQVQGCSPEGVAAACVYISSKIFDVHITQEIVAREANITEVTLRNRYKSLITKQVIEITI